MTALGIPQMLKLALDVQLTPQGVQAAALCFDAWDAAEPTRSHSLLLALADAPKPAERAALRLQCVAQLLRERQLAPGLILIDGLVHLDAQGTPGWGQQLADALGGGVVVIGISKAAAKDWPAQFAVQREDEAAPVIVTCAGIDIGAAKARVRAMHGKRRMPTLLKLAARAAKAGSPTAR
ncbi:MAG: endonuclease V [Burkholderiales bacterium PBB5]|nr:MAG: endonuclease V [Burkholderiales bacterium PBB5]